jgi:hypothetical protein
MSQRHQPNERAERFLKALHAAEGAHEDLRRVERRVEGWTDDRSADQAEERARAEYCAALEELDQALAAYVPDAPPA